MIGEKNRYKMFELFLNCLFHFGEIILNEKEPENISVIYNQDMDMKDFSTFDTNNKLFLQKYFNYTRGREPVIRGSTFVKYYMIFCCCCCCFLTCFGFVNFYFFHLFLFFVIFVFLFVVCFGY